MTKKWHLYHNDVFEGYAPNSAKARAWCTFYTAGTTPIFIENKHCFYGARGSTRREAIYKNVDF